MSGLIDFVKIEEETLTPEKYLKLNQKEKDNIAYTKVIPARLGKADFGKIHVFYKSPYYKIISYK